MNAGKKRFWDDSQSPGKSRFETKRVRIHDLPTSKSTATSNENSVQHSEKVVEAAPRTGVSPSEDDKVRGQPDKKASISTAEGGNCSQSIPTACLRERRVLQPVKPPNSPAQRDKVFTKANKAETTPQSRGGATTALAHLAVRDVHAREQQQVRHQEHIQYPQEASEPTQCVQESTIAGAEAERESSFAIGFFKSWHKQVEAVKKRAESVQKSWLTRDGYVQDLLSAATKKLQDQVNTLQMQLNKERGIAAAVSAQTQAKEQEVKDLKTSAQQRGKRAEKAHKKLSQEQALRLFGNIKHRFIVRLWDYYGRDYKLRPHLVVGMIWCPIEGVCVILLSLESNGGQGASALSRRQGKNCVQFVDAINATSHKDFFTLEEVTSIATNTPDPAKYKFVCLQEPTIFNPSRGVVRVSLTKIASFTCDKRVALPGYIRMISKLQNPLAQIQSQVDEFRVHHQLVTALTTDDMTVRQFRAFHTRPQ